MPHHWLAKSPLVWGPQTLSPGQDGPNLQNYDDGQRQLYPMTEMYVRYYKALIINSSSKLCVEEEEKANS